MRPLRICVLLALGAVLACALSDEHSVEELVQNLEMVSVCPQKN